MTAASEAAAVRPLLLGEMLLEKAHLTPAQLTAALAQQEASGKRLGTLLVELGLLDERQLVVALAEQLELGVVDLRTEAPDPAVTSRLPESVARSLTAIPLWETVEGVEVAVADPTDEVRQRIESAMGEPVLLVLASHSEIRRAINNAYRALADIEANVAAFEAAESGRRVVAAKSEAPATVDAPVVQVVQKIIMQALRDRASDVHIEPQDDRLRIRFRIDGALHDVVALPTAMAPALVSRIKVLANMNIVERRRPQDGQIATEVDGRPVDIRVATTGTIFGEKVVLRLLDKSRSLYQLHDLGMPHETVTTYEQLIRSPFGMVICAGPTGSGKTTTLYASLAEVNQTERNITTIEDPVEYVFPSINQIQINEQAGITFANGLKSILRQDPDVILVGEVRDPETARIAVQSALTGHLVLSSLHATDAVSALYRFLDMGIEAFLVASSVIAVVGQRLVRRICPHCRIRYKPSMDERAFFAGSGGDPGKRTFWRGEGCNLCARTGYSDRIGVYELLRVTPEMRQLVVAPSPSHDDMKRLAMSQGMQTLRAEANRLVSQDMTTIAEVVRCIYVT